MKKQVVQVNNAIERSIPADTMYFNVNIEGEGDTKGQCVAEYNEAANAVKKAFADSGVSTEDVKDGSFP